jgi:hypothetical protein
LLCVSPFLLCLLACHNQVRRLNKLSVSHQQNRQKESSRNVLLRNIVLERCSFFVSFKKSKCLAYNILYYL